MADWQRYGLCSRSRLHMRYISAELMRNDIVGFNDAAGIHPQHVEKADIVVLFAIDQNKLWIAQLRQSLGSITQAEIDKVAKTQSCNRLF